MIKLLYIYSVISMIVHISGFIVAYKTGLYSTKEVVEFMLIVSIFSIFVTLHSISSNCVDSQTDS